MASGVHSAAEVRRAAVGLGVSLEVALVASVETAACRVETVDLVAAAAVWEVEKAAEVKLVAAMAVAVRAVVSVEAAVQGGVAYVAEAEASAARASLAAAGATATASLEVLAAAASGLPRRSSDSRHSLACRCRTREVTQYRQICSTRRRLRRIQDRRLALRCSPPSNSRQGY